MNGTDASLHKAKKGLCPLFPLSRGVYKIEKFKQSKEDVTLFPPSYLKSLLFEGMILKENLNNICRKLASHGVMRMRK